MLAPWILATLPLCLACASPGTDAGTLTEEDLQRSSEGVERPSTEDRTPGAPAWAQAPEPIAEGDEPEGPGATGEAPVPEPVPEKVAGGPPKSPPKDTGATGRTGGDTDRGPVAVGGERTTGELDGAALTTTAEAEAAPEPADPAEPSRPSGLDEHGNWRLRISDDMPPILIPARERLVYSVDVDFMVFGGRVGTVALSSRVQHEPTEDGGEQLVGVLQSHAKGGYRIHHIDNLLSVRLTDESWPRIEYSDVETGTGPHLRTIEVGELDGKQQFVYRRDGHCKDKKCKREEHMKGGRWLGEKKYHCPKCRLAEHRVWREPMQKEVPLASVDMISAVFVARAALENGLDEATFTMIENDDVWEIRVLRGDSRVVETSAGRFPVNEIKLVAKPADGEKDDADFSGMFGLHGTIQLLFHQTTGVPVAIRGTVPVGPFEIDVRIDLERYSGTPEGFRPLD